MKTSYVAALALLSTALTPTTVFATATGSPIASSADGTTTAAMDSQCAAQRDLLGSATGLNDHYTYEVVPGTVTLTSGPTENGARTIDQNSITPVGTLVPSVLEIRGNPVKIGGSVNMFGDQWATESYYPDSTYTYTANFDSTFAHAFSCVVYKETYHEAYTTPGEHHDAVDIPRTGVWVVRPDAKGNEEAHTNECNAQNGAHPEGHPETNDILGNCIYQETSPGSHTDAYDDPPVYHEATWDPPVAAGGADGTPVSQNQTDNLTGFEPHGGRIVTNTAYHVGQPVICISPGSKGGSWRAQNGYSGGSFTNTTPATAGCNTNWFKATGWYAGSQTSNGTFISVPNYFYP